MDAGTLQQHLAELDAFIVAFEAARERCPEVDLAQFIPPPGHPLRRPVLRELVRVDLEYGWEQGRPRPLADYRRCFPELADDHEGMGEIAFEEQRLREQSEQPPHHLSPADCPTSRTPVQEVAAAYQAFRFGHGEGDAGAVDRWSRSFRGDSVHAELFCDLHRSDPEAASRLARAVTTLPEAGADFLGFRLVADLGRGSFSRVYLAQQGELANRLVALKVSTDLLGEPATLAQLQHTHIVPVYSLHRAGPFQAVCMPYFGAVTLADVLRDLQGRAALPQSGKGLLSTVQERKARAGGGTLPGVRGQESGVSGQGAEGGSSLTPDSCPLTPEPGKSTATLERLEGMSYVDSVLWLGARLADGLAHAHERGILHRDLKPANILLTDEGQPMLLDFNLSEDTKLRGSVAGAMVGGTLPYMAPEHLEALQGGALPVDARSDLYSLGVILFELLTRRHPFTVHSLPSPEVLARMIEERHQPPPRLGRWNRAVTPAVEAIIRRCLEPDPARRYQTARQLQEDLERQRESGPLKYAHEQSLAECCRKWARRHPRLTSSASIAALAGVLLLGLALALVLRKERLEYLEAQETYRTFGDRRREVTFLLNSRSIPPRERREGLKLCRTTLGLYQLPLDRPRDAGWQEQTAFRNLSDPQQQAVRRGAGELLLLLARCALADEADRPESDRRREALQTALAWNGLAETCFTEEGPPRALWSQRAELARLLGDTDAGRGWAERAGRQPLQTASDHYLTATEQIDAGRFRDALATLERATDLDPKDFCAWFALAMCHDRLGQDAEAVHGYTTALALWPRPHWLLYFDRGLAHLRRRQFDRAAADFDRAIQLRPEEAEPYLNRALARQGQGRLAEAVADLTHALELGSAPTRTYFMRAVLRREAGDADGARRDREAGLKQEPGDELSWVARGMARLQDDPDGALADFEAALRLDPRSLPALQNKAHVLAQKPGRLADALTTLDRAVALHPDAAQTRSGRAVLLARLGKIGEAHEEAEAALRLDPSPRIVYQAAGVYALTSKTTSTEGRQAGSTEGRQAGSTEGRQAGGDDDARKALQLLSSALKQGFGFDLLERDRELDPIRGRPEFQQVVTAARTLGAAGTPR
jgi:serine/threonine protein kinase/Flp pilus assembly protein TadD